MLFSAAYRALPAKGVLLVAEPMCTQGAAPVGGAYFGFYLLAMGQGRARAPQELRNMLAKAGFGTTQVVRTRQPLQTGLIVARKDG
jgi:demethylspheroidene O-methyltransferase